MLVFFMVLFVIHIWTRIVAEFAWEFYPKARLQIFETRHQFVLRWAAYRWIEMFGRIFWNAARHFWDIVVWGIILHAFINLWCLLSAWCRDIIDSAQEVDHRAFEERRNKHAPRVRRMLDELETRL